MAAFSLAKGNTFTLSFLSSKTAMLEPAQQVSACESSEVRCDLWREEEKVTFRSLLIKCASM
jgi:hypothetical protein